MSIPLWIAAVISLKRTAWRLIPYAALACVCGLTGSCGVAVRSPHDRPVSPARWAEVWHRHRPIIFTQTPLNRASESEGAAGRSPFETVLPAGSRIAMLDLSDPQGEPVNITPSFMTAGRPDLSFDGEKILFVGRQNDRDPLNVWEMDLDGGGARQITHQPFNCDSPIYLSTIYTMDADAPVYQIAFTCSQMRDPPVSVYSCRLDGTRLRRITFNPFGATTPYLISDGRLLFSSWTIEPDPLAGGFACTLKTIHTDGTDLFAFAGVHEPTAVRSMPCETADGQVVYVESAPGSPNYGGSLVSVPRTRSLRSQQVIARDDAGLYHSPSPLPDGLLLVSYRPKSSGSYGIYTVDPTDSARRQRIFDAPDWDDVDAVLAYPRTEPAGRSSSVDDEADFGELYCLDAHLSATNHAGTIGPAEIKKLRVIKALPEQRDLLHGSGEPGRQPVTPSGKRVREKTLGIADIETDGSFFLEVPAKTPLRLETLDGHGRVLQAMDSWIWVMPRERRGCIGCHEDREWTPPNRHVYALRKKPQKVFDRHRGGTDQPTTLEPLQKGQP